MAQAAKPQRSIVSAAKVRVGDRLVVLAALACVVALAWSYLLYLVFSQPMMDMDARAMAMMPARPWDARYFGAMLAMWMVMMIGMMLPSAAPVVLLFDALEIQAGRSHHGRTALFAAGYVLAWAFFSVIATAAQWALSAATLLSATMSGTSPVLAGLLLGTAGVYQLTPWKTACLRQCRSPAEQLIGNRSKGRFGPLLTGLRHGAYCIGCCWALMALLFAFGIMNLLWVAVLATFVFVEKLTPGGELLGRVGALAMVTAGIALIAVR